MSQQGTMEGDAPGFRYTAAMAERVETHWQRVWHERGAFTQPNPGGSGFDATRPKFYCLDMFPYPSGAGLHVGHPEGYTATDILCRYKRATGFNVLHPMGWDAFGLPAEQYAIQTGVHPAITTKKAIDNFRRQLQRFGFSYDWSREVGTIDPAYYKWTQWVFLKLYDAWFDERAGSARPIAELVSMLERGEMPVAINPAADEAAALPSGWSACSAAEKRRVIDSYRLAYIGETTVNWCPKLGTVLANDEVIDGRSERGGHPVLRKPLRQWMFRITAYAERLLGQLERLDWPSSTKQMQREWIGKSEGAEIEFEMGIMGSPAVPAGHSSASEMVSRNQWHPAGTAGVPKTGVPKTGVPECVDRLAHGVVRRVRHPLFVPRDPYPQGCYWPVADMVREDRFLPHIEMPEATYFVTWRAAPGVTLGGSSRRIVLDSLTHFDGTRGVVFAAVVMPDHVHWIVKPTAGERLGKLVENVKEFSARAVNRHLGRQGSLWVPERFDHIIRDEARLAEFMTYVATNPVKAGLVDTASLYEGLFVRRDIDDVIECGEKEVEGLRKIPGGDRRGTQEGDTKAKTLRVFTTRPDTLFGATYMVVAPEHELVDAVLKSPGKRTDVARVRAYVSAARNKSDVERMESKEKTGVDLGVDAINPATGKAIPVWVADYVLMGYGTGAIMAVPAHDERDYEFAVANKLPIRVVVIRPENSQLPTGTYSAVIYLRSDQSSLHSEMMTPDFKTRMGVRGFGFNEKTLDIHYVYFVTVADAERFANDYLSDACFTLFVPQAGGVPAPYCLDGLASLSSCETLTLDGLSTPQAKAAMIAWLEKRGIGVRKVNYKLRDWTFSRQRYWGEPFPIVFDEQGNHWPVGEEKLPVVLPELEDYAPIESDDPQPLLAKAGSWVRTTAGAAGVRGLPSDARVMRETNTMPGSAGSSWYFLRYCDPRNDHALIGSEEDRYWMGGVLGSPAVPAGPASGESGSHGRDPAGTDGVPKRIGGVDLYVGGSEHAVGHLLYARFWQNVLFDLGHVSTPEPFQKLFHQGLITAYSYQRADKTLVPTDEVEERGEGEFVEIKTGARLTPVVAKMSKSLKNVVNPDDIIREFGADTFRLYEMYMGPLEASKPWNTKDIIGSFRFLQRLWRNVVDESTGAVRVSDGAASAEIEKKLHRLIAGVGADIESLSLNTAIAKLMEFNNDLTKAAATSPIARSVVERLLIVLSPFCPHIAEELWSKLGCAGLASGQAWPAFDPKLLVDDEVEMPVAVLGKVRGTIMVPAGADASAIEALARADAKVRALIEGKAIRKVIVVPGKMINFVVG